MNQEFIERHSRQLILPGWSLALQEEISSSKVSIPENKFLCMYLIALGVTQFHLQSISTPNTFISNIPNWEIDNRVFDEISESDYVIFINHQNIESKGRRGTISAYTNNSKLLVKSCSSDGENVREDEFAIKDSNLDSLEIGTTLALLFTNSIKVNLNP